MNGPPPDRPAPTPTARRIKATREREGLTQAELARRAEIRSDADIGRWENGKNLPDYQSLMKLVRVLDPGNAAEWAEEFEESLDAVRRWRGRGRQR